MPLKEALSSACYDLSPGSWRWRVRKEFLIPFLAVYITSCSAADAAQFDAENDIHCAVLSEAFTLVSADQELPADQRKAIAFLDKWYGGKLRELSKSRGPDKVLAEAEPIATFVEKNLASLKDETMACTERAVDEAGLSG
jgi:hypothetical protein